MMAALSRKVTDRVEYGDENNRTTVTEYADGHVQVRHDTRWQGARSWRAVADRNSVGALGATEYGESNARRLAAMAADTVYDLWGDHGPFRVTYKGRPIE